MIKYDNEIEPIKHPNQEATWQNPTHEALLLTTKTSAKKYVMERYPITF